MCWRCCQNRQWLRQTFTIPWNWGNKRNLQYGIYERTDEMGKSVGRACKKNEINEFPRVTQRTTPETVFEDDDNCPGIVFIKQKN